MDQLTCHLIRTSSSKDLGYILSEILGSHSGAHED